jgi:hypothetical protein
MPCDREVTCKWEGVTFRCEENNLCDVCEDAEMAELAKDAAALERAKNMHFLGYNYEVQGLGERTSPSFAKRWAMARALAKEAGAGTTVRELTERGFSPGTLSFVEGNNFEITGAIPDTPWWATTGANVEEPKPFFLAWTTAPSDYDYWYVERTGEVKYQDGRNWFQVKVTDIERWVVSQIPRYNSGLHAAHVDIESWTPVYNDWAARVEVG